MTWLSRTRVSTAGSPAKVAVESVTAALAVRTDTAARGNPSTTEVDHMHVLQELFQP